MDTLQTENNEYWLTRDGHSCSVGNPTSLALLPRTGAHSEAVVRLPSPASFGRCPIKGSSQRKQAWEAMPLPLKGHLPEAVCREPGAPKEQMYSQSAVSQFVGIAS